MSALSRILGNTPVFGPFIAGREAEKNAKSERKLQQRIADVKASREKSKLLREARRKRAALAQQAVHTGTQGSSGATAGEAGIRSQLASGVSFLDQVQSLSQSSNIFAQNAADARSRQNEWQQLQDFGKLFLPS